MPRFIGRIKKAGDAFVVGQNELSGTVPTEFGRLSDMEYYLGLYDNGFNGFIPTSWGAS